MSANEKDQEFLDLADSFIALANQHAQSVDKGKVSAVILYAAARYNSFVVASSSGDKETFEQSQDRAQEYFLSEYKKMLVEHMNDYSINFDRYLAAKNGGRLLN